MSVGFKLQITGVGAGTRQSSTSSSTIAASPTSGTLVHELVVLVAYVTGTDCRDARDAGDGWRIISSVYDTTSTYGAILAVLNARFPGSSGYSGITLPGTGAYTAQTFTMNVVPTTGQGMSYVLRADLATGSDGILVGASSTTVTIPDAYPTNSQWLGLYAGGYDNGGATTTIAQLGGHNERFDTGQTSPPHGVFLGTLAVANTSLDTDGLQSRPNGNISLAVAKTNKAGVYGCVPILANCNAGAAYKRMARGRRYG